MFFDAMSFGIMGAIGIFIIFMRLERKTAQRLLGYSFALDVGFTCLMMWMHWGSTAGVLVATVAGLFGSMGVTTARALLGYIDPKTKQLKPGLIYRLRRRA